MRPLSPGGKKVYRKSHRLHGEDRKKHKSRKSHYAAQSLDPPPPFPARHGRGLIKLKPFRLVTSSSRKMPVRLAPSSRGRTPKGILGIRASGGQRDIFLTGSVSAQRLSALMGINNVDRWPRKEAPPPVCSCCLLSVAQHVRLAFNALFSTLFMLIQ